MSLCLLGVEEEAGTYLWRMQWVYVVEWPCLYSYYCCLSTEKKASSLESAEVSASVSLSEKASCTPKSGFSEA